MDPYALSDRAWCKELGQRLDRLREDRKMSRDELGEEIGVSQPTVRRLLDEGHGKLSVLVAALRALESLDQLERFIEPPPLNPATWPNDKSIRLKRKTVTSLSGKNKNKDDLGW